MKGQSIFMTASQNYHGTYLIPNGDGYGWMSNVNNTGQNFTISIYGGGGGGAVIPTGTTLYSNGGVISGTDDANWEGYDITYTDHLGNTGFFLATGTYWIAFELRTDNYTNPYSGVMPFSSPNPLVNEAFNDFNSWDEGSLGLGVQNFGTSAAPVPEPTTMILLGFGLLGLAGVNRRKK